MKLKLEISLDNAAFEVEGLKLHRSGGEAAAILRAVADKMDHDTLAVGFTTTARDSNGNAVGRAKVTR